jgi:hypothetical protein
VLIKKITNWFYFILIFETVYGSNIGETLNFQGALGKNLLSLCGTESLPFKYSRLIYLKVILYCLGIDITLFMR